MSDSWNVPSRSSSCSISMLIEKINAIFPLYHSIFFQLIPIFIGELLEQDKMSVKVLKTNDTWYGMTYHEDVAAVKGSFKEMLENGVYKADLFSDL